MEENTTTQDTLHLSGAAADGQRRRAIAALCSAIFLIIIGSGLLIAGFVVPPPGEIHNSVLVAFGEILTFAGALFGMKYHYQFNK